MFYTDETQRHDDAMRSLRLYEQREEAERRYGGMRQDEPYPFRCVAFSDDGTAVNVVRGWHYERTYRPTPASLNRLRRLEAAGWIEFSKPWGM